MNEGSHAVTCEVRIGDVIDATDIGIYRELAGGVTAANVLHGSANPIGGQNQIIKFRWGALPEELKFADAMPGVKFALGENVKQSNRSERSGTRYPQTRMGVEQLIRDRFRAASWLAQVFFRSTASRLHGPPPANTRYRNTKQYSTSSVPPFWIGMKPRAGRFDTYQ